MNLLFLISIFGLVISSANGKYLLFIFFTIIFSICFIYSALNYMPKYEPPTFYKYKLASGKMIECEHAYYTNCGIQYCNCKDGFNYNCQTNSEPIK